MFKDVKKNYLKINFFLYLEMQEYDFLQLSNYDYNFISWFSDNKDLLNNLYNYFRNQLDFYSNQIDNYTLFDKGNEYLFTRFIYYTNKDI